MDYLDEQRALSDVVEAFVQEPSSPALTELQRHKSQLQRVLEPPRPLAQDRERVRAQPPTAPGAEQLGAADAALALELSDELLINEALAARLVAAARQARNPGLRVGKRVRR